VKVTKELKLGVLPGGSFDGRFEAKLRPNADCHGVAALSDVP
jgi:hypothetical protein